MPTLTHPCPACKGHGVVPEPYFGGMVPCDCTAAPASVDPYPGEWEAVNRELADAYTDAAGEPCGSYCDADDAAD